MEYSGTLGVIIFSIACVLFYVLKKTKQVPLKTLGGEEDVSLMLIEREEISHDTRRFRFALPTPNHILGLPVGQHMTLKFKNSQDKLVSRSYTPITSDDEAGYVDLVIKVYFAGVNERFPDGGQMSQHLDRMKIGESIQIAGPKGKLTYKGKGEFHIKHRARDTESEIRKSKKIGMIAGGTGITPMLQIIRQALKDSQDSTEFYLVFANQTDEDILMRKELDEIASRHSRVHVWYTVDRPIHSNWRYSTGYVNAEMFKEHLPPASSTTQIFMCGPPPMINFACIPALQELEFTPEMYFTF